MNDESHEVIEEFMLAANEAVASFLTERHAGFLRRGHADPEASKLKQFAEFVRSLGPRPIEESPSRGSTSRRSSPRRPAIGRGGTCPLRAARQPQAGGYYARVRGAVRPAPPTTTATSPRWIRRYPDLQVHRQLTTLLAGKKPKSDFEELTVLAEHCTRTGLAGRGWPSREVDQGRLLALPGRKDRRPVPRDPGRRRGLRPLRPARRAAGRGPDPRHEPGRRLLLPRSRDAHPRRPGVPGATQPGWGTGSRSTIARVDIDRRELALVPADVEEAAAPPPPSRPPRPQQRAIALVVRPSRGPRSEGDRRQGQGQGQGQASLIPADAQGEVRPEDRRSTSMTR